MHDKENDLYMKNENSTTCECCGNVFRVELVTASTDYNDFGYRYCPFCGTITDEYALIK